MTIATVTQHRDLTDDLRRISKLERIDYVDTATIHTGVSASAEDWARAIVEHAAGFPAEIFWRAIGLRMVWPPTADTIGGWRIVDRGDTWISGEAASRLFTANAICQVADCAVSLALLARYDRPLARAIAPPITAFHRAGIPILLRRAEKHIASQQPAADAS